MKVILKQDVAKLGSLGDEVEVKRGYARNFLIPQGYAVFLTRDNKKQVEHQRQLLAKERADAISKATVMAEQLENTEIVFTMKSGESGKLFGSVTLKHIHDALTAQGIEIERKRLHLAAPLKTLGSHNLLVKLHTEVSANLEIKVTAEALEEEPEVEASEEVAEEE
ncbi:MAG: 50S ribosomal protein L9 [SAR324 cluster bacterium]|uniref:Large ribosomal subunit protein bL9 n=1 Tax=SAR324 cluster bacterium TaxID=2024889 RepID=A0A2A4TAR5_9DELT|nr:MAG: 50S ribosomal protein L9 [SAR324 cluster bacterium]